MNLLYSICASRSIKVFYVWYIITTYLHNFGAGGSVANFSQRFLSPKIEFSQGKSHTTNKHQYWCGILSFFSLDNIEERWLRLNFSVLDIYILICIYILQKTSEKTSKSISWLFRNTYAMWKWGCFERLNLTYLEKSTNLMKWKYIF